MKIGIDLDEVLVDFLPAFIEYHNATYHTSLKRDDFFSYQYYEVFGGTLEETMRKVYDFHQTPYFKNMKPIAGTQEAISLLKEGNELFIITSRQDSVKEITIQWINEYFPNSFNDIILTNNHSFSGDVKTKREYCDLLKIDALIDDQVYYALECLAPNRKIFLLDCPWNQSAELPPGISRVYSWQEIIDCIIRQ
jgi:5'(3')-deoxyribonucleotidase